MGTGDYISEAQSDERVSCRAVIPVLDGVVSRGYSAESFLEGMPFGEAHVRDINAHITWLDFCALMERSSMILGGPEGMRAFGRESGWVPGVKALMSTAGMFASAQQMYQFISRWALPSLWPMVSSECEISGPTSLTVHCRMCEGYQPNAGMFHISAGFMETLPQLLGQPASVVKVLLDDEGARFVVEHPTSMTLLSRIHRLFTGVFAPIRLLEEIGQRDEALSHRLAELTEARRLVRENAALREEFLANMSHELRTPLSVVMGSADLLSDTALDADQAALLRDVRGGAASLLALVEQVLDFSRLQRRRLDLDLAPLSLRAILSSSLDAHRAAAARAGLTLSQRVDSPLPVAVIGDVTRIRQVLDHLLDNAIKFTEEGSVTLRIAAEPDDLGRVALLLSVEDTGPGLESEIIERVFQPFEQRDGSLSRAAQGMGLGLSICRSLAAMMGGGLELESVEGVGACFRLSLNLAVADDDEVAAPRVTVLSEAVRPAAPAASGAAVETRGKVLLVEDHPVNQKLLGLMVRAMGWEVTFAGDGQQAVDAFEPGRFDAVLMDCQMPVMDGFEATRRIRERDASVPIVAVTAHTQSDYESRCLEGGMDAYVSKPVDRALLARLLDELIDDAAVSERSAAL